jgi:hypothetical protein
MSKTLEINQAVESGSGDGFLGFWSRFPEGAHVEVMFVWGDEARKVTLDWPKGTPRPESLGAFGPVTTYPNPCKSLALEGYGTMSEPCRIKDSSSFRMKWTHQYGVTPFNSSEAPLFDVENLSDHAVNGITFGAYYYDAKGGQLDAKSAVYTSSLSFSEPLPPKGKKTLPIGKTKAEIPAGTVQIEAVLRGYSWATPDGDVYFAPPTRDWHVRPLGGEPASGGAAPAGVKTK